jgi:hypothetical protein
MTSKREIKPIEWVRYQDEQGKRFWWHPDDEPPANGTQVEDDDFSVNTMLRVRLDPGVDLFGNRYDELSVLWSEMQCCNFLLAHGIDSEGRYTEQRLSVNLLPQHSTAHGYFYCRDDDYMKAAIDELVNRKILVPTGKKAPSGFIEIPLFRFMPIEAAHELQH